MEQEWLTVKEIRQILKISAMTVYRRIDEGQLSAVKIGRSFRVSRASLDNYLDRSKTS